VLLAVNGTLMRGLELNGNLLASGGSFVRETKTAPLYRLYSIGDIHPAMLRVDSGGAAIALEIWDLPAAGFAQVLGVLGEPWLIARGAEITRFGGWRAYIAAEKDTKK
jgi:gamma-glutamylcyclotransferase (GGCT)/AIG2-like uncharacterized protein YtfP